MEKFRRNAANFLDHFRRVTRKMPFQLLKNTLSVLQREITLRAAQISAFIEPALRVISALLCIPTREIAVTVIFRIGIFVAQNAGGIRVVDHVLPKEKVVLDYVPDESAEEG